MKNLKNVFFTVTIASLSMTACKTEKKQGFDSTNEKEILTEKKHGIILENMDKTVKPTEDFYRFVNGTWMKNTEIPADQTSWGSFIELRKNTDNDVLAILDDAIKEGNFPKIKDKDGNEIDSDQQKAVFYFESIMDTVTRNKQGVEPLKPFLAEIEELKSKKDIQNYITKMASYGNSSLYSFSVYNDLKNSKMNAGYIGSGRLGLSRDYYVDNDDNTKEKLSKYEVFVANMFKQFGDNDDTAKNKASLVVNIEKSLAKPMMPKEDRRDARKIYNPMSIEKLSKIAPAIDWNTHLKGIGVEKIDTVIVSDPNYMKEMNNVFTTRSVDDIKTFLKWRIINSGAGYLTTNLEKANWDFYSKTLQGAKKQRPRKERALASVNGSIGEALGKLYVDRKFPPEAKKKAEEMIANVRLGFEKRIEKLSWMSEETKKKAIEKLHKLTVKIAYPDKWKDYSSLEIQGVKNGGSYFNNAINIRKWAHEKAIKKLGKPVDRTEWGMSPQTVNAYFNPVNNEIVFPAAILQPPFYDYKADEAVNYGGIGAVIGHEISHSFDDSGARFDGDGNLNNWWSKEDAKQFKERSEKLITQFDNIIAIDDIHLNGKFTLGENIGDLGGILSSFEGFKIFLEKNGHPEKIDGFTAEQRFFLSWATVWRNKMRDDNLRNLIKTDPHAPGKYRAYVPLKNIDAFYKAFNVKEGDKMYLKPEDRVNIW